MPNWNVGVLGQNKSEWQVFKEPSMRNSKKATVATAEILRTVLADERRENIDIVMGHSSILWQKKRVSVEGRDWGAGTAGGSFPAGWRSRGQGLKQGVGIHTTVVRMRDCGGVERRKGKRVVWFSVHCECWAHLSRQGIITDGLNGEGGGWCQRKKGVTVTLVFVLSRWRNQGWFFFFFEIFKN